MRTERRRVASRVATLALVCVATPLAAQSAFPDSALLLFQTLAGRWSCAGGFARGGALNAEIDITLGANGHVLGYEHMDRPPGAYWQRSTWTIQRDGSILSVGAVGSQQDYAGSPVLFVARTWSARSVSLEADTIKSPPLPSRFTYSLLSPHQLKMVWEPYRNGSWVVGDSLMCARASRVTPSDPRKVPAAWFGHVERDELDSLPQFLTPDFVFVSDGARMGADAFVSMIKSLGIHHPSVQLANVNARQVGSAAYLVYDRTERFTRDGQTKVVPETGTMELAWDGSRWRIAQWTTTSPAR